MSPVATFWCADCGAEKTADQRPVAYVTLGYRGYWLMRRNFSAYRRPSRATNLTKIWLRHGPVYATEFRCQVHGVKSIDLIPLERQIRGRTSTTHPVKIVI